jgi:hypothetical protein
MWITIVPFAGGTFLEKKKMFDLNQINTLSSEIACNAVIEEKKRNVILFVSCSCELLSIRASPQAAV